MTDRVACPAKINTFLAVGKPDSTGYHPIRSIFQTVSLFDELAITLADQDLIEFDDPAVPPVNTVSRALELARTLADFPALAVRVAKRIPSEAGLGGGSSDAAGLLRWISSNYAVDVRAIAARVGADVPFFLAGGRARVEGYGEIISPLDDPPVRPLVIVKPDVGCPTGDMYRRLDELGYPWREFDDSVYNDFERVAPCECLDLIERLQSFGAREAGLSGSGSAVFGIFDSKDDAARAAEAARAESLGRVFEVETLPRSATSPLCAS